jgi:hypothetical protein
MELFFSFYTAVSVCENDVSGILTLVTVPAAAKLTAACWSRYALADDNLLLSDACFCSTR